ncbi:hypothetical protein AAFN85_29910 [Mucilaginibacter sp. CAU 1740]|uniref:hypothetical protein n=1 Tax=Mucilaginibacter sp. CAU 1740 TaxID=3140365 RepID=UPI00325BD047
MAQVGGTYGAGLGILPFYKHGTPTEFIIEFIQLRRSNMFIAENQNAFGSVGAS